MAKKKAKKRRSPQDATLRNIRALKKRVESLEKRVDSLRDLVIFGHNSTRGR